MEKREVWLKNTDFPSVDLLGFACSDDGAPPQGHMPIFSEVHTREDPVLVTTPDHATYHTKCQISVHFFGASPRGLDYRRLYGYLAIYGCGSGATHSSGRYALS